MTRTGIIIAPFVICFVVSTLYLMNNDTNLGVHVSVSRQPQFLTSDGESLPWPSLNSSSTNYLAFDTQMSANSVLDLHSKWRPVSDFWLAINDLTVFEEGPVDDVSDGGEILSSIQPESGNLQSKYLLNIKYQANDYVSLS